MEQPSSILDLDDLNKPEDSEESERARVEAVYSFIENECRTEPLSFYHCVLDPNSFSRTVENIYYISVLVHEGRLGIYIHDRFQIPFVRITDPSVEVAMADRNNCVVSIDMDQWKKLIDSFNIKEAKMKID